CVDLMAMRSTLSPHNDRIGGGRQRFLCQLEKASTPTHGQVSTREEQMECIVAETELICTNFAEDSCAGMKKVQEVHRASGRSNYGSPICARNCLKHTITNIRR